MGTFMILFLIKRMENKLKNKLTRKMSWGILNPINLYQINRNSDGRKVMRTSVNTMCNNMCGMCNMLVDIFT